MTREREDRVSPTGGRDDDNDERREEEDFVVVVISSFVLDVMVRGSGFGVSGLMLCRRTKGFIHFRLNSIAVNLFIMRLREFSLI